MTYAQLASLETFVNTTTIGGTLAFTFPDQKGGADVLCRFGDSLPKRPLLPQASKGR